MRQYPLPLPVQTSLRAEDFFPSDANEQARLWLLDHTSAEWPSHTLLLWGPEGAGKTHLLSIWREKMGAVDVQPSGDALARIVAGEHAPAYTLDDADRLAGQAAQEEWLQHFYNATRAANVPVLLTARTPVTAWGLTLRDIETRLKSCASVELGEPDDALMTGLLLKQFADRQLAVEAGVVDYLARRLDRTGTALRAAVEKLDAAALEGHRKISIPFAQKVLLLVQDQPEPENDQR